MFRIYLFILLGILSSVTSSLFAIGGGENGSSFLVESVGTGILIESRKNLIRNVLDSDAMKFGYSALQIILDTHQVEPRGKMQGRKITLSPSVQKDSEFLQLLTHELAHYVDIYFLSSDQNGGHDISSYFYQISWKEANVKRSGEGISSFVSGYASTDQYEDFAESFTFYIFHNREFADRAIINESLRQKYLFFAKYVFSEGQFMDTDFGIGKVPKYLWDTTKLPVSVKKYLYSLY